MSAKIDQLVIRHDAAARRCACGKHASVNTDAPTEPPPEFTFAGSTTTPHIAEPPAPTLPKLQPLPNAPESNMTPEERALPRGRQPLRNTLLRRNRTR
jgi:hypothetical protein